MNKILIIDDNKNHAGSMKEILQNEGYKVDTANDCTSAVKLVKKTKYDLLLIDLVMDPKNGVETFKEIRKVNSKAKAIYFTAFGPQEEMRLITEAFKEGMIEEWLRKPIEPEELITAIKKHVKSS